jgi:MFS-type transporter involved in bile tolerance (Atg22 family)
MKVERLVTPGRMTLAKEAVLISICFFGAFFGNIFWGSLADTFGRKTILEIAMAIMFFMSVFSVRKRKHEMNETIGVIPRKKDGNVRTNG